MTDDAKLITRLADEIAETAAHNYTLESGTRSLLWNWVGRLRHIAACGAGAESHRCSGCSHRWDGPLTGVELCGDCWRKAQPVVHQAAEAAPPEGLERMTADKLREEINKRKLLAHALVGIAHIPLHRLTAEALLEAYIVLSEADPPQIPTRLRAAQESEPTKENK